MQIEITDDQIGQMIKKAVSEQVKNWFEEPSNKYFVRDTIRKEINMMVSKKVDDSIVEVDIPELADKLATKELAEKVTDCIGYNIACVFAEKYGD